MGGFYNPPYSPKNQVYVISGAELSNSYTDTYYFDDLSAQLDFFKSKAKTGDHFTNLTPFKISDGSVILPGTMEHFKEYNYILLQNADISSKWYYAFITSVEFLSPGTTKIYYELDVIQTYICNWDLHQCFVERCHELTDAPGNNIVDEGLELGEYIINEAEQTDKFDDYSICVACTVDESGISEQGGYFNGQYSGLNIIVFDSASEVNSFINTMTNANKISSIVAIFMMPSNFVVNKSNSPSHSTGANTTYKYVIKDKELDGYTPKNNKLLTYPYKFLHVTNFQGNEANYRYEFFGVNGALHPASDGECDFNIYCSMEINPTVKLIPVRYNGAQSYNDSTLNNIDYGLTLSGFPQCAWVSDSYKAWVAQQGTVSAFGTTFSGVDLNFAQQGLSTIGNALSLNIGGTLSGIVGIAQSMAKINATKALPPQAHGENANGALFQFGLKDFGFQDMSIRRQYAKQIDGYFDMFGYAHKTIEYPSIYLKSRPYWNYIKTQGIIVSGPFSNNVSEKIQSIFNNGIRFWHGDYLGDYTKDNSPIGG